MFEAVQCSTAKKVQQMRHDSSDPSPWRETVSHGSERVLSAATEGIGRVSPSFQGAKDVDVQLVHRELEVGAFLKLPRRKELRWECWERQLEREGGMVSATEDGPAQTRT